MTCWALMASVTVHPAEDDPDLLLSKVNTGIGSWRAEHIIAEHPMLGERQWCLHLLQPADSGATCHRQRGHRAIRRRPSGR
jgi:hypothetical protein